MVPQIRRNLIESIKTALNIFGVTREEAPEVLAEILREYQEYFEMPEGVNHV